MQASVFSGRLLRAHRIGSGLSPEALAVAIERSVYSIHEYERGRVQPPVSVLARLAASLDTSIDSLFEVTSHVAS